VTIRRSTCRRSTVSARRLAGRSGGVRQLQQRGLTEEALRGAAGLQVTARALGDRPLELEAMLMLGTIQARGRRDVEEAEATLLAAAGGISALGLAALAPAAWNELAYVAARLRGDADRADEWLRLAEPPGGERLDGLPKAALLETRSYASLLAERPEEALELRREALKLREEMQPANHPDVARARMLVANALAEHKQPALARALLEKLLADQVEALGPAHPSLLDILESLAYAQLELKDGGAAATASLTRARAVATWLYGALSVRVAILDVSLAMVTADPAAAIDRLRGAIAVFTARGEPDYVERVAALQVLAELLRETRQTTAALAVNRELLLLHDRGFELEIDSVLVNIGDYLCRARALRGVGGRRTSACRRWPRKTPRRARPGCRCRALGGCTWRRGGRAWRSACSSRPARSSSTAAADAAHARADDAQARGVSGAAGGAAAGEGDAGRGGPAAGRAGPGVRGRARGRSARGGGRAACGGAWER
jgi:hypothetical protein